MKLKEILDKTTAFFREKKIETPRLDAELLIAHGLRLERIQLYLKFDQPMREDELVVLRELVKRRALGEPIAYILGYKDFYKHRFDVNPSVLIPRPETEHLVEEVLSWSDDNAKSYTILDLGCGSGCIGLSLLAELPNSKLLAVDISEAAIETAKKNALQLKVEDRVRFLQATADNAGLILCELRSFCGVEKIDILVSNPPYIAKEDTCVQASVIKFEPHHALFADEDGLSFLRNWSRIFAERLNAPGIMAMEMGSKQGAAMKDHFSELNIFNKINVIKDLAGHDRIICGVING